MLQDHVCVGERRQSLTLKGVVGIGWFFLPSNVDSNCSTVALICHMESDSVDPLLDQVE